jgi:ribonuclease HI
VKKVTIYTDGGCSPNPGPGGYGIVLIYREQRRELSGGYRSTTNNRMELTAAIRGLQALKEPCDVTLFSDSQYVVNGITKGWARRWKSKGWIKSDKRPAENIDLWEDLLNLCETHTVRFEWIRGHNGHAENERCDRLAGDASRRQDLPIDSVYEGNSSVSGW